MGVRDRIQRYGLRVVCLACMKMQRHRPYQGHLRDRTCPVCGTPACMRAWWWVRKYRTKALVEVKQAAELASILQTHRR